MLAALVGKKNGTSDEKPPSPQISHTITYYVTGTSGSSTITYNNETNGITRVKSGYDYSGHMFWRKAITLPPGAAAYINAQSNGSGTVVVEIYSDGNLLKRSESSGEFAVAEAAAR